MALSIVSGAVGRSSMSSVVVDNLQSHPQFLQPNYPSPFQLDFNFQRLAVANTQQVSRLLWPDPTAFDSIGSGLSRFLRHQPGLLRNTQRIASFSSTRTDTK